MKVGDEMVLANGSIRNLDLVEWMPLSLFRKLKHGIMLQSKGNVGETKMMDHGMKCCKFVRIVDLINDRH